MTGISSRWAVIVALLLMGAAGTVVVADSSTALFVDTGDVRSNLTTVDADSLAFVGVTAGDAHSLGWTQDGALYSWGSNSNGQLGDGTQGGIQLVPGAVAIPSVSPVVSASATTNLSIALTQDGGVYTWGNADVTSGPTPQRLPFFDGLGDRVVGVDSGGFYFLAWTQSGRLYSWGESGGGRLGRAGASNSPPALVTAQGLNTQVVAEASAGRFHGAARIAGSPSITAWGTGFGAIGGTAVTGPLAAVAGIAAGTGTVVMWDVNGQLFLATTATAALVAGAPVTASAAISIPTSGASSFYAWDATGNLYTWGRNDQGQLGLGSVGTTVANPTLVPLPAGTTVLDVGAGSAHALFIGADGTFSSAGDNASGQLGTGDTTSRDTFGSSVPIFSWPQ